MERKMVCISCPLGCRLTVTWEDENDIAVKDNKCAKGESYAQEEILAPKRVVTATVRAATGAVRRLPVKTNLPMLKGYIPALLNRIYKLELRPPIVRGQVLLKNIEGTGVDLVATRNLKKA
jgi:CxxC motif-containing protein